MQRLPLLPELPSPMEGARTSPSPRVRHDFVISRAWITLGSVVGNPLDTLEQIPPSSHLGVARGRFVLGFPSQRDMNECLPSIKPSERTRPKNKRKNGKRGELKPENNDTCAHRPHRTTPMGALQRLRHISDNIPGPAYHVILPCQPRLPYHCPDHCSAMP